jgi:NAD(P)-dependent dehydrogenase (short-subunit alcohol dehydrogenase family)
LSGPKTRVDTAGSNHLDAFRLDGRVTLITGADVNEYGIRAATRRLQATGGEAVPLRMDVTDPESVSTAVVVTLEQELGPVDIPVNNVGISRSTSIWEIDLEEIDRIMAFKIAEMLLNDNNDLIHIATGGWLHEAGKRDPERLLSFLDKFAATMPRVALRYAIEHLDEQRAHYLSVKKATEAGQDQVGDRS